MALTSDLLSVRQVAEELGLKRRAVIARIHAGTLRAVRVDSQWAVPRSELDKTPARRETSAAS